VRNNSIRHYTFEGSNFESQQTIYFSENTEIDPEVLFLGHRRLSIIDRTAAGHQPMALDGYCITFNGEIYNQLELREELEKEGIEFKGNSDTEVLLRSYIHYGEDCLHRFNGKWAFAIWDPKKKNLLLSRDRYGKKPLFYFFDGSHFAFASEIKALLLLPFVPKSPNLEQVKYFLTWRSWEHRHQTMFEGVQRVLPAHNLWFDPLQNNLEVRRYYSITPNLSLEPFSELKAKEYVEAGERLFLDAVRIRLKGGLPIGASFSGGVDSSGIVFARERLSEKETSLFIRPSTYTFSSVYETNELKKYDESKWIDFALEKSQAIGIKVEPRPERFIEEALKIAYHQDEPFDSTGIFAGWCVMSLARQHGVIVTLDGQGPDEALGGYPPHIPIGFSELLLNFKLIRFFQKLKTSLF
jgi:asparagine synthase (glutamine-hydrolysing)